LVLLPAAAGGVAVAVAGEQGDVEREAVIACARTLARVVILGPQDHDLVSLKPAWLD